MSEQATNTAPHLLTIDQVAQRLGVTVRHIRRLVAERRIPYVKWGHLLRFDLNAVSRFIDDHTVDVARVVGPPDRWPTRPTNATSGPRPRRGRKRDR
jgi:excisionase family DNA binding protein